MIKFVLFLIVIGSGISLKAQRLFVKASPGVSYIKEQAPSLSGTIVAGAVVGKKKLLGIGMSTGYLYNRDKRKPYIPVGLEADLLPGANEGFWPLLAFGYAYPIHHRKNPGTSFGNISGKRMSTFTAGFYLPKFSRCRIALSGSYNRIILKSEKAIDDYRLVLTNVFTTSLNVYFL